MVSCSIFTGKTGIEVLFYTLRPAQGVNGAPLGTQPRKKRSGKVLKREFLKDLGLADDVIER